MKTLIGCWEFFYAFVLPSAYPSEISDLHLKWATMVTVNVDSDGPVPIWHFLFLSFPFCPETRGRLTSQAATSLPHLYVACPFPMPLMNNLVAGNKSGHSSAMS